MKKWTRKKRFSYLVNIVLQKRGGREMKKIEEKNKQNYPNKQTNKNLAIYLPGKL
jgi:hypothetical protein